MTMAMAEKGEKGRRRHKEGGKNMAAQPRGMFAGDAIAHFLHHKIFSRVRRLPLSNAAQGAQTRRLPNRIPARSGINTPPVNQFADRSGDQKSSSETADDGRVQAELRGMVGRLE